MNTKILAAGLVCLSAVAMGQSNAEKPKQSPTSKAAVSQTGDAAPDQASEKRMHKPIAVTAVSDTQDSASKDSAPSNSASNGSASNASATNREVSKKQAVDDWHAPAAKTTDPHRVAPSVMSDGKAASANAVQPAPNTAPDGNSVGGPRDTHTGQASGRERPRPIGSSGQDVGSPSREASSGMATGKKSATDPAPATQTVQPNTAPKK